MIDFLSYRSYNKVTTTLPSRHTLPNEVTIMTIGERIKHRREELCITQTWLAEQIGTSKQNLYKYENGIIANIPTEKIEAIAKALHTTPAYLMGWSKEPTLTAAAPSIPDNIIPMPKMKRIPLIGTIACGKPILAVESADDTVTLPEDIDADFSLRCKGDSMVNARIFDGDIVYIKQRPMVENGEIAAVIIGEEATLKRVYYTPGSDRITLRACNPVYPDMEYEGESLSAIHILGKAVAFTSTIRL